MNLYYMEQPPKKWTFEQPELKTWTEAQCQGKVLNLFAGKTRLSVDEYRVDISPEHGPDLVSDAFDLNMGMDRHEVARRLPEMARKGLVMRQDRDGEKTVWMA
jgi:hypothetical protein